MKIAKRAEMLFHQRIDWFYVRLFYVYKFYHPDDVIYGPIVYQIRRWLYG